MRLMSYWAGAILFVSLASVSLFAFDTDRCVQTYSDESKETRGPILCFQGMKEGRVDGAGIRVARIEKANSSKAKVIWCGITRTHETRQSNPSVNKDIFYFEPESGMHSVMFNGKVQVSTSKESGRILLSETDSEDLLFYDLLTLEKSRTFKNAFATKMCRDAKKRYLQTPE